MVAAAGLQCGSSKQLGPPCSRRMDAAHERQRNKVSHRRVQQLNHITDAATPPCVSTQTQAHTPSRAPAPLYCRDMANEVCTMEEATEVYPRLGIVANVGVVAAGTWAKMVCGPGGLSGENPITGACVF